ncbi:TonB family protein [uncultured Lacinutrix sp.]|uniref:TonB family protein n=1 Tax=uncultured Lacinutrix sp. TaxID=574032 RepID=UPI002605BD57|nr:TonB family protein [uncultured Lacinutrix sp.]
MNNSHKALAITFLIVASIALSLVNFEVAKYNNAVTETLIDITPVEVLKQIEEEKEQLEQEDASSKTNKAYNDTKQYKHFAQAYKTIAPPKDYEDPRLTKRQTETFEINKASENDISDSNTIQNDELTSFESVNSILNKRTNASQKSSSNDALNKNSTIIYSLKGRTDTFLPIPIYLCEARGKIVVNITVNNNGKVTSTSINSSSTSSNTCLQQHALEYAKESRFNNSSKKSQIGTITFSFQGKK